MPDTTPYERVVTLLKQQQSRLSEILEAIERRDISAGHVRDSLEVVAEALSSLRKKIPSKDFTL